MKEKDRSMKTKLLIAVAILAIASAPGCTNREGESEAPVFVTLDLPLQPLSASASSGLPLTIQTMVLESHLKNPTATDPQHFADVQINTYTVSFSRRDGGTRVPATEQFSAAVLLPSEGTVTLTGFPIISAASLQRSPFDQLLSFNGGIDRETGLNEIHIFYSITFYGTTVSGHRVQSQTATGDVFIVP
jgi:hypothetical protein